MGKPGQGAAFFVPETEKGRTLPKIRHGMQKFR